MVRTQQQRRKTIIINPELQKRMIIAMSVTPAIGLSVAMIAVCYFSYGLFREATINDLRLDGLMPLFLSVSAFVCISAVFLVTNSVKISHLVAGPAYRMCQSIKQIREGDVGFEVSLRKGDYLTEIRDELNLLLDTLNENPPPGFTTRAMKAAEEAEEAVLAAGIENGAGDDEGVDPDHASSADESERSERDRQLASTRSS